jgi:hypothetical protein
MKSSLAIALLSVFAFAGAEENRHDQSHDPSHDHNNAIYVSPVAMLIYSGISDITVISGAYEHRLTQTGYSLFVPVHAAYREDETEFRYALGMGLGLRKYFGTSFSGSYLTGQSDLMQYRTYKWDYPGAYTDANGMRVYPPSSYRPSENLISITQLAYGYKWDWSQFTLDLSLGGAFYAKEDEKYTNLIAGANLGFPFNAAMFGLH